MRETWRWFGPDDPVSLDNARQAGAAGLVTALHHITDGRAWSDDEVAGLTWDVCESIPVTAAIKLREGSYRRDIDAWKDSLESLVRSGVATVCAKRRRLDGRVKPGHDATGDSDQFQFALGRQIEHPPRREITRAALDRFAHFQIECGRGQIELRGDGGEADVAIEARQQTAAAGRDFDDVRGGGEILTHGEHSTLVAGPRAAANSDKLSEIG